MEEAPFEPKEYICLALSHHVGIKVVGTDTGHYHKSYLGIDEQEDP
jgi:hypothetical protein